MDAPRSCWVVTDGAPGNENQAIALARALGAAPQLIRIDLRWPWRWLAPTGPLDVRHALLHPHEFPDGADRPELAIGCGRAGALVVRALHSGSAGRTRTVQILDPRRHRGDFDVLVVPSHDRLQGDNVVACDGSLNSVDDAWLAQGRLRFPQFEALPSPRTAVLLGGPVRGVRFDHAHVDRLLERLDAWHARDGGSFLVTCTRRTPSLVAARMQAFLDTRPGVLWRPGDSGPNPYAGLLGWADRIVVTPDSANLMSEACATGTPVLALEPGAVKGKLGRFAAGLIASGRMRELGVPYHGWRYAPLREVERVAQLVRSRLDQLGGPAF